MKGGYAPFFAGFFRAKMFLHTTAVGFCNKMRIYKH